MAAIAKVFPFIVLLGAVGFTAFVGFAIYAIVTDVMEKTSKRMEKKNINFSKDGMRIGVKEVRTENYVDQTQSFLVKAWNYSTWPAYKSRLWNKEEPATLQTRQPYSRSSSSMSAKNK